MTELERLYRGLRQVNPNIPAWRAIQIAREWIDYGVSEEVEFYE